MANYPAPVQRAIDSDYSFNLGDYISRGFNIVTKNTGLFIGGTLVLFILMFLSALLGIIPFVGQIASGVITFCLMAGIYLAAKKSDKGEILQFGDFFNGFQFFVPFLLLILIYIGVMIVIMLPFFLVAGVSMSGLSDPGELPNIPWWIILLYIPLIYLFVSWGLAPQNIIFHRMSAWDAMEASRKVVTKKWFMFFLFNIVVGIIAGAGMILIGIGALFTIPAAICMQYAAYEHIIGVGDTELASLTDHLVD